MPFRWLRRMPICWRLSLWYGGVLGVILVTLGAAVYGMMHEYLASRTDAALIDELSEVDDEIQHASARAELHAQLNHRFGDDANNDYQVFGPTGEVIFRSRRLGNQSLSLPPRLDSAKAHLETTLLHGHDLWRVASRLIPSREGDLSVQVATSLEPDQQLLKRLAAVMLLTGPMALVGAMIGGYALARRALTPVDRMVVAASEITSARLGRRLHVGESDDELSRLARALNKMIERLDESFRDMKRFTGDAAHELRTPLAIIHNAAEVGLGEPNTPAQCRRVYEDILEEVERLSRLADQLLYLAREDAGTQTIVFAPVQLDALAREVIEHLRLVAEEQGVTLSPGSFESVVVDGDADRLRRVLLNLVDNGIKFTAAGGRVAVSITIGPNGHALVSVTDTGIGITAEHLPHVFDRFYRADPARGGACDGAGLGLAICKSIVQLHGGEIRATSTPGQGTCIEVVLPRSAKKKT